MPTRTILGLVGAAALCTTAAPSLATWSIILVDTRSGEIALGSCTCLTALDLQGRTPVVIVGVGAATAQSASDTTQYNRTFIRDRMAEGLAPAEIVTALSAFDSSHTLRQYGIVDTRGRAATFTGQDAGAWAGGQTGEFLYSYAGRAGHVVYAVQGNVLTGAPVVQAAVDALRNTDGDLPARLMASMEAARAMGGDGRCSCPGGVTSCGAPPPTFTKSAHIGYMIVARAGDRDGATGVYATGPSSSHAAVTDINADGRPDLAVLNATAAATISLLANQSAPGARFAQFGPAGPNQAIAPGSRVLGFADITGDTVADLVTLTDTVISVKPGLGGTAFGPSITQPLPGIGSWLAIRDIDAQNGPDVVALTTNAMLATALNDGAGALQAPLTRGAGTGPTGFAIADIDGNNSLDAVVVSRGTARLLVLKGNNNGTYTASTPVLTPPSPQSVALADFNGDGFIDAACANQGVSPSVTIYFNDGSGLFSLAQTLPLTAAPTEIVTGDFNADGHADLAMGTTASRFFTLVGSASGTFVMGSDSPVFFGINRITASDLNADGRTDIVYPIVTQGAVGVSTARPDGSFPPQSGTGGGNYFLTLNVPNQAAGAPDPVFQLQAQFDAWRAGLTGKVDAVQSRTTDARLILGNAGLLRVALRDWRGEPVTTPGMTVTIRRVDGGPGNITAGPAAQTAPGEFEFVMTAADPADYRTDSFEITVQEAGRSVVLMPLASARVWQCPTDFDGDHDTGTDADIEAFFACLAGDCCALCLDTDINGDGDTGTDADIERFFALLVTGGCEP